MNTTYQSILLDKAARLHEAGYAEEARSMLAELLTLDPDNPQLQYQLGMLSMELQDNRAAGGYFRELVRLEPQNIEGQMLLGMVLAELGQQEEAIAWLRGVLAVCPNLPEVRHRLGLSLADLNRHEEAFNEYQEVLRLVPGHIGALCGLGLLFTATGQPSEARRIMQQAFQINPKALSIINNLGRVCKIGHADESLQWFQRGLDIEPDHPGLTSNYLYALNYVHGLAPEFIAGKYREYAPRAFHPPKNYRPLKIVAKASDSPVRIGYVSADFYGHSVAFFLEPIMHYHDRQRFEIFCYSNRAFEDTTTERLKRLCTGWRCIVGMPDTMVAEHIADDRIDILVDLSGHTAGHRLGVCALKPAPVQVSWIGCPNTSGLPQIDYYLSDPWCDPPGMTDGLYSERLYRLPRIFCCYLPPEEFPPVSMVPSAATGSVTFGCFNNLAKVNRELVALWGSILHTVSDSRMFIKGPALDDPGTKATLLEFFTAVGIGEERLLMQGVAESRVDHLALYSRVDIALDTYPYHGTTTTCEALWMGVPVVTLAGVTHVARVGVSLLHAVGLDDLVAERPEEYVATAVTLANDRQRLLYLRENLRQMMACSPLMDAAGVTREVEEAYMAMMHDKEIE